MSIAAINLTDLKTKHHHPSADDRRHVHSRTKDEGIQVDLGSESVSRKSRTAEVATQTDVGQRTAAAATGRGSFSIVPSFHLSRKDSGKAFRHKSDSELSNRASSKASSMRSWHEFKVPWVSGHSKHLTSEKEFMETRKGK